MDPEKIEKGGAPWGEQKGTWGPGNDRRRLFCRQKLAILKNLKCIVPWHFFRNSESKSSYTLAQNRLDPQAAEASTWTAPCGIRRKA